MLCLIITCAFFHADFSTFLPSIFSYLILVDDQCHVQDFFSLYVDMNTKHALLYHKYHMVFVSNGELYTFAEVAGSMD